MSDNPTPNESSEQSQLVSFLAAQKFQSARREFDRLRGAATADLWAKLVIPIRSQCLVNCSWSLTGGLELMVEICRICLLSAPDHSMIKAVAFANLASIYQRTGEKSFVKIEHLYRRALDQARVASDRDDGLISDIEEALGRLYLSVQNYAAAEPLLLNAFAYWDEKSDQNKRNLLELLHTITNLYGSLGRPDQQAIYFKRKEAFYHERCKNSPQDMIEIGRLKESAGDFEGAIAHLEQALE